MCVRAGARVRACVWCVRVCARVCVCVCTRARASQPKIYSVEHCPLFNPLNAELNPICHLLALGAHHILHVGMIRVNAVAVDKG